MKKTKCPRCGSDLNTIYPTKDKRLCKFDCGYIIMKQIKNGRGCCNFNKK